MEFGLREYLLILGALLIVGLLADGIRRTIKHKREGLKLDLMAAPPASPEKPMSVPSAPSSERPPLSWSPRSIPTHCLTQMINHSSTCGRARSSLKP